MDRTLEFYNKNHKSYIDSTINLDMSEAYKRFLNNLNPPAMIMDLGCGSGRDSLYFKNLGYNVLAVDGSVELCKHVLSLGIAVQNILFENLNYNNMFDGIWACASLLHIPMNHQDKIWANIIKSLKNEGCVYASYKIGNGENVVDGKYYTYIDEIFIDEIIKKYNIILVDKWVSGDVMKRECGWLNFVLKKKS